MTRLTARLSSSGTTSGANSAANMHRHFVKTGLGHWQAHHPFGPAIRTSTERLHHIIASEATIDVLEYGAMSDRSGGQPEGISIRITHRLHTTCIQNSGDERD
jgi:hypothetical protein